jgi:hypothetical protein
MSTIITPSEDQINIVITDDAVNVNVTSEPVVVNVTEEIIEISTASGAYPLPTTVYSVFGRTGSVVAQEGDYDLNKLSDVVLLDIANNDVLSYNGTNWVNKQMDLSAYVPYTGATTNVNLGVRNITTSSPFIDNITNGGCLNFKMYSSSDDHALNNNDYFSFYPLAGYYAMFSFNNAGVRKKFALTTGNIPNNQIRYYTMPSADGTLALTSELGSYVTLGTSQIITANKTFQAFTKYDAGTLYNTNGTYTASTGYNGIAGTSSGLRVVMGQTTIHGLNFSSTGPYTYTFPSATGTLALTSDIPSLTGYVTLATDQLITGIKTFQENIKANSTITLSHTGGFTPSSGYSAMKGNAGGFSFLLGTNAFASAYFDFSGNVAQRNYVFPNASGTLALTSDLTNFVTLIGVQTLSNKTFSDVVNLSYNGYKLAGITGVNPVQMYMSNGTSNYLFNTNSFGVNINNDLFYSKDANNRSVLSFNNTAERIYSFPNATGTIALTSDIPSTSTFVTLAGTQTITGSKSFTSGIKAESGLFLKESTSSGRLTGFVGISATATGATQQIQLLYPSTGSSVLVFDATSTYGYTFPSATGTLALTSDIPSLTGYVTYTGATANVNLGEYGLLAGQVTFDQTPTGVGGVGIMRWNDTDGTLDLGLKGGNVTLQVGQEIVARVVNKTGADLLESGYKAVRISSAQGQRLAVQLAQANNDLNSVDTIGMVTENISNNEEGFITILGQLHEINTTGSLQGETWTDGDVLYLSPITAGAITNVKPSAPDHMVVIGYVEYAHAIHGKIYCKTQNGYELEELHDVAPLPYVNKGVLYRDTITNLWKSDTIANLLGYTPANAASVVPYTGATTNVNLGANSITASSLIKSGGTSAQILAANGSVITAGTNITISGGTISSTGGGGGGGADIGIVYVSSLKALNYLSIY